MMSDIHESRLLVYLYLKDRCGRLGIVNFSLNDIVLESGYSISTASNGINSKVVSVLNKFEQEKIIEKVRGNYSGNKLCVVRFTPVDDSIPGFCLISYNEIDKISDYLSFNGKVSLHKVLLLLAFIRSNKLRRPKNHKDPSTLPLIFYKHIKYIAKDLSMSEITVCECIKVLEELDFIVASKLNANIDSKNSWNKGVTVFVEKTPGWEQELEWGKQLNIRRKVCKTNS